MSGAASHCQYGWRADEECNAWGPPSPFHGCYLPHPHSNRACRCLCGTTLTGGLIRHIASSNAGAGFAGRVVSGCGTNAGYTRHLRAGQPACEECRRAHAAYVRDRTQREVA